MTYEEALKSYKIYSEKYMNKDVLVNTDDKTHTHVLLRSIKLVQINKDGTSNYTDDMLLKGKHDRDLTGIEFDLDFFFSKKIIEDTEANFKAFVKLVDN